MTSFATAVYRGKCCRRHVVGQRIVSDVSVVFEVFESSNANFYCLLTAV